MKHIPAVLILMSLVACGGDGSSANKGKEEDRFTPMCKSSSEKMLCIDRPNYILNTRLTNFTKNLRVSVGKEDRRMAIIDSCKQPGILKIISNQTGSSIFFRSSPFLNSTTHIEIIDLGDDCKGSTVVISTDLTEETFRVDENARTISVDLD